MKKAFTLIEILVVLAILSILAALLFPVLARARENARRSSCQSNLKQIGLGIMQYAQDFDETFPILVGGDSSFSSDGGVFAILQPYVKNTQVYQCPSEPYPPGTLDVSPWLYVDYQYNLVLGYDNVDDTYRGLRLSQLTQSALTVMAADAKSNYPNGWTVGCPGNALSCAAGRAVFDHNSNRGAPQRHLDTQNFLFTDGHVKAFRGESATQSAQVWNQGTPGSISKSDPTYNTAP
jgi:prepilin-type N-terminal cleavage/methylation domain-containing protein/prepilin-type processing-associated H-X9-DG protein